MTPADHSILMDAANLSALLAGFGILFTMIMRNFQKQPDLKQSGLVKVDAFQVPELVATLVLMAGVIFVVHSKNPDGAATPPAPSVEAAPLVEGDPPQEALPAPPVVGDPVADTGESHVKVIELFLSQQVTLAILALLLFFIGAVRGNNIVEFFGLKRLNFRQLILWSVPFFMGSFLITWLSSAVWQHLVLGGAPDETAAQPAIRQLLDNPSPAFVITLLLTACVVAPVVEEVAFRGFIYPTLKRFTQPMLASFASSGLFAVMHTNLASLAPLWILALLLVVAYEMSGTLLLPIIMHACFNGVMIALTLFYGPDAVGA